MNHDFTILPQLAAAGLDDRLTIAQRIACTCGCAWTCRTDAIAQRIMAAHLTRVETR